MKIQLDKKKIIFIVIAILAAALTYYFLPADCPEAARRTAFVFVIAALFWALEIIPLFATSFLVILLLTFLLCRPGGVLNMEPTGFTVFLKPFASPVIMLFLGGFVLAKTLQKHAIDKWVAFRVIERVKHSSFFVLAGVMLSTAFLSLWISKTATTAVMLAMIHPLVLSFDKNDPFRKGLILGVAFAAVIGGIITPIGSPPNAIALGLLAQKGIQVPFLSWMLVALPLAIVLLMLMCVVIFLAFKPFSKNVSTESLANVKITAQGKMVALISIFTVAMWLTSSWHHIPESLASLLCAGLFIVLGLCSRTDFINIHWDILVLMWGGLAMGEAMEISGLAKWLVTLPFFNHQGFMLVLVMTLLTVFLSTFMSNTATINLMIPIALGLSGENPLTLAIVLAIASSFDLALPISTPPMALAYGTGEVRVKDMLKVGVVFTLTANLLLLGCYQFLIGKVFGL
jgi:sodium-dependent dicarboxylate transporter 2/3/5